MPFVKLDCGIVDSTLWADRDSREIFITALLMAVPYEFTKPQEQIDVNAIRLTGFVAPPGWYGFVSAAGPGIVRRAGLDLEAGIEALEHLGSPDPGSRTPTFEGRRMIRIDGGYLILNYMNYRDKDYTAAERMRRLRQRKKDSVTRNVNTVTRKSDVADAYAKADTYADRKEKDKSAGKPAFDEFWKAWSQTTEKGVAKGQAEKAWNKIDPDHAIFTAILIALQSQKDERARFAAAGQFYPPWKHPSTWLNGKCWLDEPQNLQEIIHAQPRKLSASDRVRLSTEKQANDEREPVKLIP